MITRKQAIEWLEAQGYSSTNDRYWEQKSIRYDVQADHWRLYHRDAAKQWHLIDNVSFVDLFPQEGNRIADKWHHVIGKNLSPYFTGETFSQSH